MRLRALKAQLFCVLILSTPELPWTCFLSHNLMCKCRNPMWNDGSFGDEGWVWSSSLSFWVLWEATEGLWKACIGVPTVLSRKHQSSFFLYVLLQAWAVLCGAADVLALNVLPHSCHRQSHLLCPVGAGLSPTHIRHLYLRASEISLAAGIWSRHPGRVRSQVQKAGRGLRDLRNSEFILHAYPNAGVGIHIEKK